MKFCNKCQTHKHESEFNKHSWCKLCANQSSREWYYKNKDQSKLSHKKWLDKNPDYISTYYNTRKEDFQRWSKNWHLLHKEERNKKAREHYQNNKSKYIEALYRRKARKFNNGGNFTVEDFINLCEKYDNMCLSCKASDVKLTPDHIIPLSKGGSNSIENIQPLCLGCNRSKGTKIIDYREVIYA